MDRIPTVLTPATLPPAELTAARLDGELFAVDEGWVCADEPDRSEVRVAALAALLPVSGSVGRLVMMGLTAAWLYGATDAPPARHEVCSRIDERASPPLPRRFLVRERALADADECAVGCLRVTTPARTAFDLARLTPPGVAEWAAIDALVRTHGIRPADLADGIRLPGGRLALERIEAVRAQQGR
ncbi:MAG: type IV toxin-antitoxin system AbiEi family antitoxin [Mycetocola sp.]